MDSIEDLLVWVLIVALLYEAAECLEIMNASLHGFGGSPLNRDQDVDRLFALGFQKIYNNDPEQFKATVRMNQQVFDKLFDLVKDDLTNNLIRSIVSAKCRLFLTLAYLAHGGNARIFSSVVFKTGQSNIDGIIRATCAVLCNKLGDTYLAMPTLSEWTDIAKDYYSITDLPNCIGAIDAKCLTMSKPNESDPFVLLGACDANYIFTGMALGAYDGNIIEYTEFGKNLLNEDLVLPDSDHLPDTETNFPYYFVASNAFPLKRYIMRPYPGLKISAERELFNKRLASALNVIENAFGVLVSRWQILTESLNINTTTAEQLVKSTILLHNFVIMHDNAYCAPTYVDQMHENTVIEGQWRKVIAAPLKSHGCFGANNSTEQAFELRDKLKDYIVSNIV